MNTITDTIFMVRPARFGFNPETAENNAFQERDMDHTKAEVADRARSEFDQLKDKLIEAGIEVIVYEDSIEPRKTDAVFPNNWITMHGGGVLITYPMFAESRRPERRTDIVEDLEKRFGFDRRYYFEHYEEEEKYLEGTGSMILDRTNRIIYACLSERTNIEILEKFSVLMDYQKIYFHAEDSSGIPIYHTNVMMALGEDLAIICLDTLKDPEQKKELLGALKRTNKKIIEINEDQMAHFAGNMIQLKNKSGEAFMIMSEQAYKSLDSNQIEKIKKSCQIIHSPLYQIEKSGGGSARCMIAEIFY